MGLVPEGFTPPELLTGAGFVFSKLTIRDVYLDYYAWYSNIHHIKQQRGGDERPDKGFTLEDNLIDLGWHQKEFENKDSFAYSIKNTDLTEIWGSVYLYPASWRVDQQLASQYEVDVSRRCTKQKCEQGFEDILVRSVVEWLAKNRCFKKIYFSNASLPKGMSRELIL